VGEKVLGIKSSKSGFAWIVVDGDKRSDAFIVSHGKEDAPAGDPGEKLAWIHKEIIGIHEKHKPRLGVLKMSDGPTALTERTQVDGVVLLTFNHVGIDTSRVFPATLRSQYSVRYARDAAPIVALLPIWIPTPPTSHRDLLIATLASLPS
jgi:hypothetical protein